MGDSVTCDCGKRFASSGAHTQHLSNSPRHTVACDCGKRFKTPDDRDQHRRSAAIHVRPAAPAPEAPEVSAQKPLAISSAQPVETKANTKNITEADLVCCGRVFNTNAHRETSRHHVKGRKTGPSASNTKATKSAGNMNRGPNNTGVSFYHESSLYEDLDWSLCDKDCGWCGRCISGDVFYD